MVCLTILELLLKLSTNFDFGCGNSADDDDEDDDDNCSGSDEFAGCASILWSTVDSCDSKLVGFDVRSPNVYRIRWPLFERGSFFIAFSLPILMGTLVDNSKFFSTSSAFNDECGENRNDDDDGCGGGDDVDGAAAPLATAAAGGDGQKSSLLFSEPDGKCYKSW